ncbi:MAG: N-acetylglucosamine-6-phosphate deacetylase [Sulfobacillus acidophilus]|uniref:N-acetylglucosamine-6-phosphate deacetylase n=1 Tax=Sulfobacillus acidophilus TaxID=53633 RepID=A0A2T2WEJ0_9FIRM|nr:MAG: N-acetylglucosamine-6-phosphate deacetylase [Sulfobacillus acidophilus]
MTQTGAVIDVAGEVVLRGRLVLPDRIVPHGEIIIDGERIAEINVSPTRPHVTDRWTDGWIFPGLIDLHVHGIGGRDFMDATDDAFQAIDRSLASVGCTAYLGTTMSAPPQALQAVFEAARTAAPSGLLGIHMEGPFIHPEHRGAQSLEVIRPASVDEIEGYVKQAGRLLRRITLAPEGPGALELVNWCHQHAILVSAGHSHATFDEALAAFDAGVGEVTHLFNAMPPLHHRNPGLVGAALARSDVKVEMIVDGIHLHPAIIQLVARLKGPQGVLLVTDAIRATLLQDGQYDLGGQTVTVIDGVARTSQGNLAGSTLTLNRAVFQFADFAQVDLFDAVRAASLTPAQVLGLYDQGAIRPGYLADLVLVDTLGRVRATWRRGHLIFDAR